MVVSDETDLMLVNVNGQSMWPFLRDKAEILVRTASAQTFRLGDIVLYKKKDQAICHRLVKMDEGRRSFWIRGDASFGGAEKVIPEQLIGRVVGVVHGERVVSLDGFFRRVLGWLAIMAGPAMNVCARLIDAMIKRP